MIIKKLRSELYKEEGSAIVLFVVILMAMTLLSTTMVTMAKTQHDWSMFNRRTSNSYHLARSGAEKVVDSMNKEITKALPNLMEIAAEGAHSKLMAGSVKYEGEKYDGSYRGAAYEAEYKAQLKKAIYDHITDKFIDSSQSPEEYKATKSDAKDPVKPTDINVVTTIYKHGSKVENEEDEQIKAVVDSLIDSSKIGREEGGDLGKDAFAVEVKAWAEGEDKKTSLSKSRVLATVSLEQIVKDEELLEEYEWDQALPETIQSAIISFGDFVINNSAEALINGDVSVKGTGPRKASLEDIKKGNFPEPDERGGIVISDGGKLKVNGNAFAVNNIQTTNSQDKNKAETSIEIGKDAIANTIAINDYYPDNKEPWRNPVDNNRIKINRNVYMDDDLRIDRYVQNSKIEVKNSVFGISDGAREGYNEGNKTYLNPNESSGVFAMGKGEDGNKIIMGRAFLGGQAYINFGDGNGFHRLHESAGEPFEDVYYLEEYRSGEEEFKGNSDYLDDFEDLIEKDKIKIKEKKDGVPYIYAPAVISANGTLYRDTIGSVIKNQEIARNIFYNGIEEENKPVLDKLTSSSDWNEELLISDKVDNWKSVILNPITYYNGDNTFDKDFNFDDKNIIGYRGLEGYMMAKRGVFYEGFENSRPKERSFEDLVSVDVFTDDVEWSRNNPIKVISKPGKTTIDIDSYSGYTTAIVSTDPDSILELTGNGTFRGYIISAGKIEIKDSMTIDGIVIAGNEKKTHSDNDLSIRQDIRKGEYAGIQILEGAKPRFNYNIYDEEDRNIIFEMRFLDKSLQRKLYDCLGMTNYKEATSEKDLTEKDKKIILGANEKEKVKDLRPKVRLSSESVISSEQEGLQFVINSLKKL